MHALNNLLGGPYVTMDACERAARQVVRRLSEPGVGAVEDLSEHLDPDTGFLSIDVINALGSSVLGIHVEGDEISWLQLKDCGPGAAAFCQLEQSALDSVAQGRQQRWVGAHQQHLGPRCASWSKSLRH